jgi:hypothetical protein
MPHHLVEPIRLGGPGRPRITIGPPNSGHVGIVLDGVFIQAHDSIIVEDVPEAFFRGLDRDWRGWTGDRGWSSMDGGCKIGARHDGVGHISVTVSLRGPGIDRSATEPWSASLTVIVEPAQLASIADQLAAFVA